MLANGNCELQERLRVGAVSYLNSKPLIHRFEEHCPQAELVLDVPSRLADQLSAGSLDVALIPSIEAFLDPDYEIVSDACVATRGPVLSVKLYSRVHPGSIRTLALDEGSRTSAALTQILLNERYGVRPELRNLPLNSSLMETDADAVLLIGDRAIRPPKESFHTVWDLGDEWVNWTGLPFVFAMWVARRSAPIADLPVKLSETRDLGLQAIESIAQAGATQLGLSMQTSLNYLTRNLHFRLGDAERAGLKLFHQLADDFGLPVQPEIVFKSNESDRAAMQPVY